MSRQAAWNRKSYNRGKHNWPTYILWCRKMGQKRCYFEKRTGEVIENKGSDLKNKAEQTGKQSGEVVENTFLWKKLSGNKPENEPGHLLENKRRSTNEPATRSLSRDAE